MIKIGEETPELEVEAFHDNEVGLKAAAFVRAHDGEVRPASWQPGSRTLQPGLDLVGRV